MGTADASRQAPATPRHRYRVGSITKTFTATAVMQLVRRGNGGAERPAVGPPARARERRGQRAADAGPPVGHAARSARRCLGDAAGAHHRGTGGQAGRGRAGAAGRRALALLEPRLLALGRAGSPPSRDAVRPTRAGAPDRPRRADRDVIRRGRADGPRLLRRALQRPGAGPAGPGAERLHRRRRAGLHGRRPVPLGSRPGRPGSDARVSRVARPHAPRTCHGRPRAVDASPGAWVSSCTVTASAYWPGTAAACRGS